MKKEEAKALQKKAKKVEEVSRKGQQRANLSDIHGDGKKPRLKRVRSAILSRTCADL